jgi:hypothetical protein
MEVIMFKNRKYLGILVAVVLVLLLVAGGFALYRAGFAHGVAANLNIEDLGFMGHGDFGSFYDDGRYAAMGHPFSHHGRGFGFNPLGGLFGLFFFGLILFLIFRGIASLFWGRRMHMAYGPHGHPWGPPPWASEAKPVQTTPETQETDE